MVVLFFLFLPDPWENLSRVYFCCPLFPGCKWTWHFSNTCVSPNLLLRWPSVCLGSWRSSGTTCGAWLVCLLLMGWSSWITHSMKIKEESGYIAFLVERDIIN